jgi:hypothetical protein
VTATVNIVDASHTPVPGATVTGSWSGVVSGSSTTTTDAYGNAVLNTAKFKRGGTVTFTVTGVSKASYLYNSAANLVTSASIAAATKP